MGEDKKKVKAFRDLKVGDFVKVGRDVLQVAKLPRSAGMQKESIGVVEMRGGHKIHGEPDQSVTLE